MMTKVSSFWTTTHNPCVSAFNRLKDSIILPMSQGACELFHSNILHYLAEKEPDFFHAVLKELGFDINYKSAKREYKHTDLTFFGIDVKELPEPYPQPILIIENKIKSLPTRQQAEAYLKKFIPGKNLTDENRKRLLFLLPFSNYNEGISDFTVITYSKLGEVIKNHLGKINDNVTVAFVKEYADFTIDLNQALDCIVAPDENSTTVGQYFDRNSDIIKSFEDLRLSSIAWKLRMSYIVRKLKERLSCESFEIYDNFKDYGKSKDAGNLLIGASISNNKPIVDCFLTIDDNTEFFIQLDNGIYNHGVTIKDKAGEAIQLIKNKADKDKAKSELLENLPNETAKKLVDSLKINKEKPLSYNNMFYSHDDDVSQMTLTEVLDKMAAEINHTYTEYIINK